MNKSVFFEWSSSIVKFKLNDTITMIRSLQVDNDTDTNTGRKVPFLTGALHEIIVCPNKFKWNMSITMIRALQVDNDTDTN